MTSANDLIRKVAMHPATERVGVRQAKEVGRWVRQTYASATAEQRVLPSLLLVGAQRCGTTALTEAIFRLPMVERPRRGKGSHYFSYNHHRGWGWFRSQFPTERQAERVQRRTGHPMVCFDACPYYLFHPLALERMAAALPDAKILVMLRDPVRRAESHYHHSVAHGHEELPFDAALDAEEARIAGEVEAMIADPDYYSAAHEHHSYVAKGRYAPQLRRLFDLYPAEQVLVLQAEAFYREPDRMLRAVTDLAGLPTASLAPRDDRNGHRYEPMSAEIKQRLIDTFRDDNEELYDLLGERYDWMA